MMTSPSQYCADSPVHSSCDVLTALAWLVQRETAATSLGAFCVHHPTMHHVSHFMQSHIRKVHAYLAVTCHLHIWQNDRDLIRAAAVILWWNGYLSKVQHRQLTLENKNSPATPCWDLNP